MKKQKQSKKAFYSTISIISLIILIILGILNNPGKYSWCVEHGWTANVKCFILAIEHSILSILFFLALGIFVAFTILVIIEYTKKPKK